MMSFPEFLESSQASVSNISKGPNDDTSPIHLVLGNEAGDADSIISSLSLAYVNGRSSDFLNVPLVSIQRSDLPLRRDVVYLLDMADVSAEIMERNNLHADDVAWLVPHQANLRIIDATARRMGLGMDKVMINIERYGNTTGATIPLCLYDWRDQLKNGESIILTAFGGGFTWGGA